MRHSPNQKIQKRAMPRPEARLLDDPLCTAFHYGLYGLFARTSTLHDLTGDRGHAGPGATAWCHTSPLLLDMPGLLPEVQGGEMLAVSPVLAAP